MEAEALQKRIERYAQLLADRQKAGAPGARVRLFRKKLKRFQRRLRKLKPQAPPPKEAEAATQKPAQPA